MKRFLSSLLFLSLVFILPAGAAAQDNSENQEEMSDIQITLQEYKEDGYELSGPVQYLGKTRDKIKFYKNSPVAYRIMDAIDETGEKCSVKKHDFVYVLSKHGHVVLIRVEREGENNA